MNFDKPLVPGKLVQRYKRFLADVILADGAAITASCPNTGAMLGLTKPGSRVWLSQNDKASRKYRYTLEVVEADLGAGPVMVGINTGHPNAIVSEAIKSGAIQQLGGYAQLRREVKYGAASRVDILLEDAVRPPCYVEVKNVHLMRTSGLAEFPDSRTERGAKHLGELAAQVAQGKRAVMLYLIQRADARMFDLARDIDPVYAAAAIASRAGGVEMLAYRCEVTPTAISLQAEVPILAPPPK